jgi:hypothetical protein
VLAFELRAAYQAHMREHTNVTAARLRIAARALRLALGDEPPKSHMMYAAEPRRETP